MDERIERDLRVGLAALLDPVAESHPRWETSPAAERVVGVPVRGGISGRLTVPWAAALAALLLVGLLAATLFAGGWRPDRAVVIAPTPTPTPTAATADDEGTDILATTKARPLPAQPTCPPGSDPDALGPADQERPSAYEAGEMAFDRHAGRVVLLADEYQVGSNTWTFDVCTNTWQRMSPAEEPPPGSQLVYDADSDRTVAVAFSYGATFMSYDLAGDRWMRSPWFPEIRGVSSSAPNASMEFPNGVAAFYHDPSGLIVLYNGATMWAYDVDTDTLAKVRQRPDPSRPDGAGAPDATVMFGAISIGYDAASDLLVAHVVPRENAQPETWTFSPVTGTWRLETSVATPELRLVGGYWWESVGTRAVFDEASAMTVFTSIWHGVAAYDAGSGTWRTLYEDDPELSWWVSMPAVYDAINARIVGRGGPSSGDAQVDGMSAFSTATRQWRLLLPPASAGPATVLPSELVGRWSAPGDQAATLTLAPCAVGGRCGTFERIDEQGEHCVYGLVYRSGDTKGISLQAGMGDTMGCAWSPWSNGVLRVTPWSADTITVVLEGVPGTTTITMTRAAP